MPACHDTLMLSFAELGFPPGGRAYFFLLRQEKVAKKKATPGCAVGYADFPARLAAGGGCGTRAYGPQTVLALYPPAAPLLGAAHGGVKGVAARTTSDFFSASVDSRKKPNHSFLTSIPDAIPGPLGGAEQRRRAGGCRFALSEPQASLANRPARRVAQGIGRSPTPTQGPPFLCLLSFGEAKESNVARKAKPQLT